jgi:hypothetical protein
MHLENMHTSLGFVYLQMYLLHGFINSKDKKQQRLNTGTHLKAAHNPLHTSINTTNSPMMKNEGKVAPVTKDHDMKTYRGCGGKTPGIFNLGAHWR